jgi:hypothetical protein
MISPVKSPKNDQQEGKLMTPDLAGARWTKSRACSAEGCVEVAQLPGGHVALRDSKDAGKAAHIFDSREWSAFISGVKNGEFDLPAS